MRGVIIKKILLKLAMLIFVIVTFFIILNKNLFIKSNIKEENNEKLTKKIEEEKNNNQKDLNNINEDIVGTIKIPGTSIDEYIVQGEDNDYYLNHNIKKEEDIAGSVVLDYRNDFEDKKLLIYGHNARRLTTVPFHDLEKFLEKSFYDKYQYIELELNNKRSIWKIFSVVTPDKQDNTHMKLNFTTESWKLHLDWLKDNSIYDTKENVDVNDKIIILQTCNYKNENTYILVSAKKV